MLTILYSIRQMSEAFTDSRFDTPAGGEGVNARHNVYLLSQTRPDFIVEIILAAREAGVSQDASVLDLGPSFPWDLIAWSLYGHSADKLAAADPYVKQYKDLPYLRPILPTVEVAKLLDTDRQTDKRHYFEQVTNTGNPKVYDDYKVGGMTLYEAGADSLPIATSSIDVITSAFSWQQIDPDKQPASLREVLRLLKNVEDYGEEGDALGTRQQAAIFAMAASGNLNKEEVHEKEIEIAKLLSLMLGIIIVPPKPLQAGFTYEDALEILPAHFNKVYAKFFKEDMPVDSRFALEIVLNSFRSLFNQYTDEAGNVVNKAFAEIALQEVVGTWVEEGLETGQPMTIKMDRALIICSELSVPGLVSLGYEPIFGPIK